MQSIKKTQTPRSHTATFDFADQPVMDMLPDDAPVDYARVDLLYRWVWIGAGVWACVLALLVVVLGVV
jgi:hypothetical protein